MYFKALGQYSRFQLYQTWTYWILVCIEQLLHPLANPMQKYSNVLSLYWTPIHCHIRYIERHALASALLLMGIWSLLVSLQIFNTDETELFWQMLSHKTLNLKDITCHRRNIGKLCVSVSLSANTSRLVEAVVVHYRQEQTTTLFQECWTTPGPIDIHVPPSDHQAVACKTHRCAICRPTVHAEHISFVLVGLRMNGNVLGCSASWKPLSKLTSG